MTIGIPHASTVLCIHRERRRKKTDAPPGKTETSWYVASQNSGERTAEEWAALVRRHWGVENPNHWRRDACLLEDLKSYRGKQRNICAAFQIGRTALLAFNADWGDGNLNKLLATFRANPAAVYSLVLRGQTRCRDLTPLK